MDRASEPDAAAKRDALEGEFRRAFDGGQLESHSDGMKGDGAALVGVGVGGIEGRLIITVGFVSGSGM
jgi:hypothetical protein